MSDKGKISTGESRRTITALIEKLSPVATHIARGEIAVMQIKAEGMAAINEKMRRAGYRIAWKEGNIESIARIAEEYMSPDGREEKAKNINQDWAATFADKCENTSDEEMQKIWAKILAGEADNPGTFSKKTLSVLSDMSKKDAKLFTTFCQFVWQDDENKPFALIYQNDFRHKDSIYQSQGIDFGALDDLESIGLIRYSFDTDLIHSDIEPKPETWYYHDIPVEINGIEVEKNRYSIPVGYVLLIQSGRELFPISGASRNDEFFNYVIDIWQKGGHNPVTQTPAASK